MLVAGIVIASFLLVLAFSADNQKEMINFDIKTSEKLQSIEIKEPQLENKIVEKQSNERFGDAFTIMPHQIQPGVDQPILESFDNVPKPSE